MYNPPAPKWSIVSQATLLLAFLAVGLALAGCAGGTGPQANFMLGYAHVEQDEQQGFEPIVSDQGGVRTAVGIDGPVALADDNGSGLRLGGRFAISSFTEDLDERTVAGEPLLEIEDFVDLAVFVPQFTASYRQVIGDRFEGAGFIEPGLGVGPAIGVLSFGSDLEFGDTAIGRDIDETESEVGLALSPFLRGGYTTEFFAIGLEGGYQWTTIEFEHALGENPREWYVGVFFAVQLGEP